MEKFLLCTARFAITASLIIALALAGIGLILLIYPHIIFTVVRFLGGAFCLFALAMALMILAAYIKGMRWGKNTAGRGNTEK